MIDKQTLVEQQDSLLEFPCDFPIKVMGASIPHFAETIGAAVRELVPDFDPKTINERKSNGGKYTALTVTVHATGSSTTPSHPVGVLETEKLLRFEAVKWTVTGAVSPSAKKTAGVSNASEPFTSSSLHERKRAAARAQVHPANRFIFIVYFRISESKIVAKIPKSGIISMFVPANFASGNNYCVSFLTNHQSV